MKIVVDINHPAHVHYFKNFIWEMEKRGHEILITASHKDVATELLQISGLPFIDLGSYGSSPMEKMLNVPIMDIKMYRAVKGFNPDILMGFSSIRAAHVSKLIGKPSIILDDTEHAKWEHRLYVPFANTILTPNCFMKELGPKHLRFDGYLELAALHPNYFKPDPTVLEDLGLNEQDRFFILRFISWDAGHDIGQQGIRNVKELVDSLERCGRVLISAEGTLPTDLERFRISVSPEKIHHLLHYATLFVGEGATMAAESAVIGTPAIYISSLAGTMGNFIDLEERYDLVYSFVNSEEAKVKALEMAHDPNLKARWRTKCEALLGEKIDVTAFLARFVEDYPSSVSTLEKENGLRHRTTSMMMESI